MLLLARYTSLTAAELVRKLRPEPGPKPSALPGWASNLLRYLQRQGMLLVTCTPELCWSLSDEGYAFCARFQFNEYPSDGFFSR